MRFGASVLQRNAISQGFPHLSDDLRYFGLWRQHKLRRGQSPRKATLAELEPSPNATRSAEAHPVGALQAKIDTQHVKLARQHAHPNAPLRDVCAIETVNAV